MDQHLSSSLPSSSSTKPTGLSIASMPEKFHPLKSFLLPKRAFGSKGQMRSFRAEWCEKYSWLHYDNSTDAAYCYICMKAELGNKFLASTKHDPAFISKGFKNWKDATIAFNAHLRSDCHKEGCEILELRSTTNDVAENLSKTYKEENELNRMMFIKFLQNVRFLARQGLSLRGHKDDEDSNFTQLLLLRSIGCPEVLTWMKK